MRYRLYRCADKRELAPGELSFLFIVDSTIVRDRDLYKLVWTNSRLYYDANELRPGSDKLLNESDSLEDLVSSTGIETFL